MVFDNALENKSQERTAGFARSLARKVTPLKLKVAMWQGIRSVKLKASSLVGKYRCPVCKNGVTRFDQLPRDANAYGFKYSPEEAETCNAANYSCPICGAADRERLYALYLQEYFRTIAQNYSVGDPIRIIDFAPTSTLSKFIKELIGESTAMFCYRTADLYLEGVDDRVDIMEMPIYQDDSVDFFVCSHILEHVADDQKALRELYRILKPGGRGILVVPIVLTAKEIDEDPSVTDVGERWRRFGQDDHVRLYSKEGFLERAWQAGFTINPLGSEHFGLETFRKHGISDLSVLYIAEKPQSPPG